ncbi:MAG: DNA-directed RNA polymerase subunit alpha [Patescibacteria group bacterium]|nr:DNA-directed RNA polymerase subunit alpha [Patescibacteria group bacterium]
MINPNFTVNQITNENKFGEFVIEPLELGYGHTIGNALRRVLLGSIPGVAVTSVRISGVKHRFSTVPGVKENVVDLLLNIKNLSFRLMDSKEKATIKLNVKGPKKVTAADLEVTENVEIVDKDQYICSLADKKSKLEMEMTIEKGLGYSLSEERPIDEVEVLSTDAVFTPVERVNYTVESTRVGRQTNLDKLILKVWTDGSITPREALEEASKILSSYFLQVYEPKVSAPKEGAIRSPRSNDLLEIAIDELDLPTRIHNSLKNGGIETLRKLIETPKKELVKMRNMGGKSIITIEDKLKGRGLSLS